MPEPSSSSTKADHEDVTCPICLSASHEVSESVVFCKSPCGHIFCVPCLEHFLLKPKSNHNSSSWLFGEDDDDRYYHQQRPNTGSCPLCRRGVNLFDLINLQGGSQVYSKNSSIKTWPICDRKYRMQSMRKSSSSLDHDQQLLNRLTQTEGAISGYGLEFDFSSSNPGIRFSSQMFTSAQEEEEEEEASSSPSSSDQNNTNYDQLEEFLPLDTFHFFAKTMTFQGNIQFPSSVTRPSASNSTSSSSSSRNDDYRYDHLEVLLQFNENGHFVRDGYLRWKLESSSSSSQEQQQQEHFPLDGTWEVLWTSGQSMKINVQRHCFYCFIWYKIELDDNHCPKFSWPAESSGENRVVLQSSKQSIPPGNTGPLVGETLEWNTTSSMSEYNTIVWKRLRTDLSDAWKLIRLKPHHQRFAFKRIILPTDSTTNNTNDGEEEGSSRRPTYHSDQLWGNTFCQAFCVGLASYHFVGRPNDNNNETGEEELLEAYISYEHPRTSSWPPLDNGSAVPSRVPFRNTSYDQETRTFRGDICWLDVYGSRWQGEAKWSYEIRFDPNFLYVEGGTCRTFEGRPNHEFGLDLVYVNAAIEDPLRESIIRTNNEDDNNTNNVNYDSASESTKRMIRSLIASLERDPQSTEIDFNLV